jgi:cytochrome c553
MLVKKGGSYYYTAVVITLKTRTHLSEELLAAVAATISAQPMAARCLSPTSQLEREGKGIGRE